MRKTSWKVGIGLIGALLASVVVLPGTASAAATGTFPVVGLSQDELGRLVSVLPADHHVGNCAHLAGSKVTLQRPDGNGNATLIWDASVLSAHPQPGWHDTWHAQFTFKTARGTFIGKASGGLDSPDLTKAWQVKNFQRVKTNVRVPAEFYDLIGQVDWWGEC